MEQLVQQAADRSCRRQRRFPLTIRTQGAPAVAGARARAAGQACFVHVPGIKVLSPLARGLRASSELDLRHNPVVFSIPDGYNSRATARGDRVHGARQARVTGGHTSRRRPGSSSTSDRGREGPRRIYRRRGRRSPTLLAARQNSIGGSVKKTNRCSSRTAVAAWSFGGGGAIASSSIRLPRRPGRARRVEVHPIPSRPVMTVRHPHAEDGPSRGQADLAIHSFSSQVTLPRPPGHGVRDDRACSSQGRPGRVGWPLYELYTEKVTQEVEATPRASCSRSWPARGRRSRSARRSR